MATRRLTRVVPSRLDARAGASANGASMVVGRRHALVRKLTEQLLELSRTAGQGDFAMTAADPILFECPYGASQAGYELWFYVTPK